VRDVKNNDLGRKINYNLKRLTLRNAIRIRKKPLYHIAIQAEYKYSFHIQSISRVTKLMKLN